MSQAARMNVLYLLRCTVALWGQGFFMKLFPDILLL